MNIQNIKLYEGADTPNYFHPSVCKWNDDLVMTVQTFDGAGDTYGPVEESISNDNGESWSCAVGIPALETVMLEHGIREGVADVRPFYHKLTDTVIAIGCNTFYGKSKQILDDKNFDRKRYQQHPVYAIKSADGSWSERKKLSHPFFESCNNWRVASAQLTILSNGDVIIPIYLETGDEIPRYCVCTLLCSYDGNELKIKEVGSLVNGTPQYAIVEPSVTEFRGKFYLTLRGHDINAGYINLATDGRGFLAESGDGLHWGEIGEWKWDDGMPLITSTTQQHWMNLGDKLYLVYTRKDESNIDVFRWRAPLYMAEFDADNSCLIKNTEEVVIPLERKKGFGYSMGNFHVSNISDDSCVVSDAPIWYTIKKGKTEAEDTIADYESFVVVAIVT